MTTRAIRLAAILPLEPRGLSRVQAAGYIGISPSKFDELVKDGRMPAPKEIDGRTVWDRRSLDMAFEALPDRGQRNPIDEILGMGSANEGRHERRNRRA